MMEEPTDHPSNIGRRLEHVRQRIAAAAARCGRRADDIRLLAVSKTVPPGRVALAIQAGQTCFAENRVQELLAKAGELPDSVTWHLIGHLQGNKIRKALEVTRRIHSIDSADLARQIDRIADEQGLHIKAWLQVNVGGEDSKFGLSPEAAEVAWETLLGLPRLEWQGLMTVPPFDPDPEAVRPAFVALRQLRDRLEAAGGCRLPRLSMGMSHDYEVAIEEGATDVRVGSAIFGARAHR